MLSISTSSSWDVYLDRTRKRQAYLLSEELIPDFQSLKHHYRIVQSDKRLVNDLLNGAISEFDLPVDAQWYSVDAFRLPRLTGDIFKCKNYPRKQIDSKFSLHPRRKPIFVYAQIHAYPLQCMINHEQKSELYLIGRGHLIIYLIHMWYSQLQVMLKFDTSVTKRCILYWRSIQTSTSWYQAWS